MARRPNVVSVPKEYPKEYLDELAKLGMPFDVLAHILSSDDRLVTPTLITRWKSGDTKDYVPRTMDNRLYYTTRGMFFFVDAYGHKNGLNRFMTERGPNGLTLVQAIQGDDFETASQRIQRLARPQ